MLAQPDKVKQSHRVLMALNHTDRGGSIYLATKINEAKDAMLSAKDRWQEKDANKIMYSYIFNITFTYNYNMK